MKTEALFRSDAYLRECDARVIGITDKGVLLDRTVFYPRSGGQAADKGHLITATGQRLSIIDAGKAQFEGAGPDDVLHILENDQLDELRQIEPGQNVHAVIDWERRFRHMRFHTAAHLLCSILPYPVEGCSITSEYARLDFVTNDPIDREDVDARLSTLVSSGKAVLIETMTDEELLSNPALIRTMSVKPPMGFGQIRLVRVEDVDLQPCGGTHVANTIEIGPVRVAKTEKKTARTRRVVLAFSE